MSIFEQEHINMEKKKQMLTKHTNQNSEYRTEEINSYSAGLLAHPWPKTWQDKRAILWTYFILKLR